MKGLLHKSFVIPYYKAFFGFFLLLFVIFGVFIKAEVHLMLGNQIIQSSYALVGLLLTFSLYSSLQWNFHKNLLKKTNYRVFHQLGLIKISNFYNLHLYIWFNNHIILILYTVFLSILCINLQLWTTFLLLWLTLCVLYFSYASLLYAQLRNPLSENKVSGKVFKTLNRSRTHYYFWFSIHLKENRPLLLLASKFISLFMLNLFFSTFQTGDYDNRWLQFGILCVSFVNYPLLKEKRDYEALKLHYFINMPSPFLRKITSHLAQIVGVILPEIIFIIYQIFMSAINPHNITLVIFMIALHLGLYGLSNSASDSIKISRNAFISFFLLFFGILYAVPWLVLSAPAIILFLLSIKSPYKN